MEITTHQPFCRRSRIHVQAQIQCAPSPPSDITFVSTRITTLLLHNLFYQLPGSNFKSQLILIFFKFKKKLSILDFQPINLRTHFRHFYLTFSWLLILTLLLMHNNFTARYRVSSNLADNSSSRQIILFYLKLHQTKIIIICAGPARITIKPP